MKPKSIIWFDRLFWASMAASAALVALSFFYLEDDLDGPFEGEPELFIAMIVGAVTAAAVMYAVSILLWFFASQRASNPARWMYSIFTGLGVVLTPFDLFDVSAIEVVASLIVAALSISTIVVLFLPISNTWFRNRDVGGPDDVKVFE